MTLDLIDLCAIVIWFGSFAMIWHLIRPVLEDWDEEREDHNIHKSL